MKKIGYILALACILISCGARKSASRAENKRQQAENKGSFPLPEDNGRFVRFEIGSVSEYIDTFSEIARHEMEAYGIPASITLAQGILESGVGMSPLARKSNNHFGIKCHKGWDGPAVRHDDDKRRECFRKYNHPLYSYRDHSIFLSSRVRYEFLFKLDQDDYKGWARGLKKAGYATDPRYANKLISFIERYDLHRFDRKARGILAGVEVPNPSGRSGMVEYEIHEVVEGDTLYSLSQRYFVPVEAIMALNNMQTSLISVGQELKIRPKK